MYAQIDNNGRCYAVSDFNAQGSISVPDNSVLGKTWDGTGWQEAAQEESLAQPDRIEQVAASMEELSQKVDLIGQLQMRQFLSVVEGGASNVDQSNA